MSARKFKMTFTAEKDARLFNLLIEPEDGQPCEAGEIVQALEHYLAAVKAS